jgi:nicotinate-nucleotide pyrophosphorylase
MTPFMLLIQNHLNAVGEITEMIYLAKESKVEEVE